ncbi:MAG TPA: homoserine dehydrogenase [Terriglobales bacterium]|nr:homoserine dehydrogenase [Terriglobales bacterium]
MSSHIGIGIAGYGTVGRGTADALAANAGAIAARTGVHIGVAAVCRRSAIVADELPRGARALTDWRELVAAPHVAIVVETIGGTGEARDLVRASLAAGKPVVTANKNLIAEHGDELFALARANNVPLAMEAAVAGAVPVLRAICESMSGDRLLSVRGILNGTANYILTQMESAALSFADALAEAQRAGYAEADPTLDVEGIDARDKLCILARLAFGGRLRPAQIATSGISRIAAVDLHYARRLGGTVRLIAAAERNGRGFELSVRPWLVDKHSMLAGVEGAHNAVLITGERAGAQMYYGRGAGGGPTGIAVASDVIEIARHVAAGTLAFKPCSAFQTCADLTPTPAPHPVSWYLRLTVRDRPGIVARVAEAIARQRINIDSVVQEPGMSKDRLSFVITVEPVSEPQVQRALEEINGLDFMLEPVLLLRIG